MMTMKFWRSLRWPPRRVVLWHTAAAVPLATVVALGAYLSYHYHQLSIENRQRVDHAYEVLDVVDGLFISVQNADAAQRDYIITGDEAHLAAFQAALEAEAEDSQRLHQLLAASATQEANLARLDAAVAAKVEELRRTIAERRQQGFQAAQRAIRSGDGGAALNAIRKQASQLADDEHKFLVRRQMAVREHDRHTLEVGVFIAVLSVVMRLFIAFAMRRMHAARPGGGEGAGDSIDAAPEGDAGTVSAGGLASKLRSR